MPMLRALSSAAAILALALVASCATSRLVKQECNPDYVGKSFKTVMVVGVTAAAPPDTRRRHVVACWAACTAV